MTKSEHALERTVSKVAMMDGTLLVNQIQNTFVPSSSTAVMESACESAETTAALVGVSEDHTRGAAQDKKGLWTA